MFLMHLHKVLELLICIRVFLKRQNPFLSAMFFHVFKQKSELTLRTQFENMVSGYSNFGPNSKKIMLQILNTSGDT